MSMQAPIGEGLQASGGAPELPWLTMLPFEVLSRHAPWLRPPQSPFEQKTQMVHCRRARAAVSTQCLHCRPAPAAMHARKAWEPS